MSESIQPESVRKRVAERLRGLTANFLASADDFKVESPALPMATGFNMSPEERKSMVEHLQQVTPMPPSTDWHDHWFLQ